MGIDKKKSEKEKWGLGGGVELNEKREDGGRRREE